ncbi:5-oxoprolinase subunit PxpB [Legionella saoudiensis]|uniref:5-oxoprolinase subunit PxpB n=1 Tax=Legionella saoudiensis TaxID=1750561 RepID=UPI0007312973|nr:5-oxoprolinase subunit PxpB [Legionella saoudiensis]
MSFAHDYQIVPLGDSGLTIYLTTDEISETAHQQIQTLWMKIEQITINGLIECVPAYASLALYYDPRKINFKQLKALVQEQIQLCVQQTTSQTHRRIKIPVCYDPEFAPDIELMAIQLNLTIEQIIKLHTSRSYLVYMLGFIPGFAYLGKLPETLVVARHATPRLVIPAGSVGIAGYQTAIYPVKSPAGWQLIGRTPLTLLSNNQDAPTLLQPGDQVSFQPIDKQEFLDLEP